MFSLNQLPNLGWISKALSAHGPSPSLATDTIQENEMITEDIQDVITELLFYCNIPYHQTPYDRDLHDLCIRECDLKMYPIDNAHGKASILKYIPCGVIIASRVYAHLNSRSTQVFVALYTAFLTWIHHTYTRDAIGVDTFTDRFVTGRQQANGGLDGFSRLLHETNFHFPGTQANAIITASLNFLTSTILDLETRRIAVMIRLILKSSAHHRESMNPTPCSPFHLISQ